MFCHLFQTIFLPCCDEGVPSKSEPHPSYDKQSTQFIFGGHVHIFIGLTHKHPGTPEREGPSGGAGRVRKYRSVVNQGPH